MAAVVAGAERYIIFSVVYVKVIKPIDQLAIWAKIDVKQFISYLFSFLVTIVASSRAAKFAIHSCILLHIFRAPGIFWQIAISNQIPILLYLDYCGLTQLGLFLLIDLC